MKSTIKQTLPLDIGWLSKIAKEAVSHGQRPGVVLSFVDAEGKPVLTSHSQWIAIPLEVFKELLGD